MCNIIYMHYIYKWDIYYTKPNLYIRSQLTTDSDKVGP